MAAIRAATGSVTSHEMTISRTFPHFTFFGSFAKPAPIIAPVETCVVETGSPAHEAADTSAAVVVLAVNDSARGSGVNFVAIVSNTFRAARTPPKAMEIVTTPKAIAIAFDTPDSVRAPIVSAAILDAS